MTAHERADGASNLTYEHSLNHLPSLTLDNFITLVLNYLLSDVCVIHGSPGELCAKRALQRADKSRQKLLEKVVRILKENKKKKKKKICEIFHALI